jgi:hypothetical protein
LKQSVEKHQHRGFVLHPTPFVRKERIGIEEISADRILTTCCFVRTNEEVITNSARSVQQSSRPIIASHPVGAQRRRMIDSAKQSIGSLAETWIASLRSQ